MVYVLVYVFWINNNLFLSKQDLLAIPFFSGLRDNNRTILEWSLSNSTVNPSDIHWK